MTAPEMEKADELIEQLLDDARLVMWHDADVDAAPWKHAQEHVGRKFRETLRRYRKLADAPSLSLSAAPECRAGERETTERALRALIHFAACAHDAMDNSEELPDGTSVIGKPYWDVLCLALDILNELPDDRPGYIMSAPAKAQWALRNFAAASSPSAEGWRARDGFVGTEIGRYCTREGVEGVVLQQVGTAVVHVYRATSLTPAAPLVAEPGETT